MAQTPSSMIPLGAPAPAFILPNAITGNDIDLLKVKSPIATVIFFICNHCPFVKHINEELVRLTREYTQKQISFIGINSNDVSRYPEDSPERMKEVALELGYTFPYLFDESQEVAKAFGATCTPDFFIYNNDLKLVYRGQLDDSRPSNGLPVNGNDIRNALDCLIEGTPVSQIQKPGIGCNIKWK